MTSNEIVDEQGNFSSLYSRNASWSFWTSSERENDDGGKIQNGRELAYDALRIFAAFWTSLAYAERRGMKKAKGACSKGKTNDDRRKRREESP